jgi:hypothetical protein
MNFKSHRPTDKTRQQAQSASGLGLPQDQIAALIGIAPDTLRKHYEFELGLGKAQASAAVAKTLFNKATTVRRHHSNDLVDQIPNEVVRDHAAGADRQGWWRDCDPDQQPGYRPCLAPPQPRAGPQG